MRDSDAKAFDEALDCSRLFERLEGRLSRFVFGYTRDYHVTQDLVQETFLRAYRNLHRYRGKSSLTTWIHSIARNLCLDHLKVARRSRIRLLEVKARDCQETRQRQGIPDSLCSDPTRPMERAENYARVGRALNSLSRDNQNLVILRMYQGLSSFEIARRSHGSPASVRSRICRALKTLSDELS